MAQHFAFALLRDRNALARVGKVTLMFLVVGAAYALLAPKWYRSVVTVVPVKQQRSAGLSSLVGGELGGLAAGLESSVSGAADAPRIAAVLQSVAVSDAVIAKFELQQRYREKYLEGARETLWKHCEVKTLTKPNLVQLSCEDKDPAFVQKMLDFFAEYGNQVFRTVSVSSASEEVRFLNTRASELRRQADSAAAAMLDFQEKHDVVDLETQSKAVVSALAALQSQRISKQLELDFARSFSAPDEPGFLQLESQLALIDRKLRELEQKPPPAAPAPASAPRAKPGAMFPAALAVPQLRSQYEKLYRDRKVAEASLVFALERLESARAAEARDTSTFQILDPPALPTRHARPRRMRVMAIAALLGLATAVGFEWMRSVGGPGAVVRRLGG